MSRIDVSKIVPYALLAPPEDVVTVSKLVAYVLLTPGESGPDTSNKQGHVYVQIVEN